MTLAADGDASLVISFARRSSAGEAVESTCGLIDLADEEEFQRTALNSFAGHKHSDVLRRALGFMIPVAGETGEGSFLSLFSALESTLTFFRRENDYVILPKDEFSELERDLKKWLKQHPLLAGDSEKRGLIYEKIRELNRFPFSHVFRRFCDSYGLYLDDLWPLVGQLDGWPLLEIRHRLVHGDPFASRPAEAFECARAHLRWTAERMLLSVLGWPAARSNVSPERLARSQGEAYINWPAERARFA